MDAVNRVFINGPGWRRLTGPGWLRMLWQEETRKSQGCPHVDAGVLCWICAGGDTPRGEPTERSHEGTDQAAGAGAGGIFPERPAPICLHPQSSQATDKRSPRKPYPYDEPGQSAPILLGQDYWIRAYQKAVDHIYGHGGGPARDCEWCPQKISEPEKKTCGLRSCSRPAEHVVQMFGQYRMYLCGEHHISAAVDAIRRYS